MSRDSASPDRISLVFGLRFMAMVLALLSGWQDELRADSLQAPPLRGSVTAHDPSTIIKCKDKYYLFYTGSGISWKSSTDKIFWSSRGKVFASPPSWTTNAAPGFTGTFWAPDIFYLNGRYCLYYAVSTFGSQVSGIGLVTNPTLDPADPNYLWTDQGPVITSTNGSPYNTIDPSVTFDASGNPWMSFGSYWNGIYIVQLDPATGLRISSNSPVTRLAFNSSIEASCVFRRGGYYYLLVDWGSCCDGVNSTYNIRIGRSTNITGPYLDKNGVNMVANGGSLFLQGTGKFTGPGHFAVLAENGNQWFSYHYYDAGAYSSSYGAYGVADFDLEPLSWTADNWPYFTNDWSAVYNFQNDARDENGQYYGLLQNGASITNDAVHGHVLNLNGVNEYVQLPPGVAFARTFVAVVKWNGGGAWQRIFDFGVDTTNYVMLTPSSSAGKLRCDIRVNNSTQSITAPAPLSPGVWTQVALTLDGQNGTIYVNGSPVVTSAITFSPLDVKAQTNHLGRSKFVADPYFNGQIASFRVYGRALSASEIAAPQPVISQPADGSLYWPGMTILFRGGATDLADVPLANSALNWRVEYVQDGLTNIIYGPVAGITNGSFNISTNAAGGGIYRVVLTATDGAGRRATAVSTLSPANPPPNGWSAYYPFNTDAGDARGHFNGMFNGGASIQNDATRGNVLNLSGANQFVSLPAGVSKMQTFMAWVKWNGGGAWQRIFDFGNDTNRYTVLTPSAANGKMRFNISVNSAAGEQIADAPSSLPVGIWTHVAVVTDGSSVVLYTNGVPVVTNATDNLIPAHLNATDCWLGKSHWPDPYFSGQMSAVRMFSAPLSAAAIVAPQVVVGQPAYGSTYHPGDMIQFNGGANDFYDAVIPAVSLTWNVSWRSSTTTNTIIAALSGVTNGFFSMPASGSSSTNGYYRVTLVAADSSSRKSTNYTDIFPALASAANTNWASYYPFTSNAADASNNFNGVLNGGASIQTDPARGKVLNLSGSSQYVSFPAGIGTARTFSGWVNWRGGNAWQRILDFGLDTQRFFFLTPCASDTNLQFAITAQASNYTQRIEGPPFPTNVWTHVAVTLDGRQGILYLNGQAVGVNNSVNLLPSDLGTALKNYLGRSEFSDPYFNGQLDSLKINSRTLSPPEIFGPTVSITQPVTNALYSAGLSLAYSGAATDYSDAFISPAGYAWSGEFHHDGITDSFFGPTVGATNGTFLIPANGPDSTNVFYRIYLTVADASGNQQTAFTDVLPRLGILNFDTVPTGLRLSMDGQEFTAPASVVGVSGMIRNLSAPSPQSLSGSNYSFVVWSDGGAATHDVMTPTDAANVTASFVNPVLTTSNADGALMLQWPAWAAPFTVWSATNLAPPVIWTQISNSPATNGSMLLLALPNTNASSFYRLQLP